MAAKKAVDPFADLVAASGISYFKTEAAAKSGGWVRISDYVGMDGHPVTLRGVEYQFNRWEGDGLVETRRTRVGGQRTAKWARRKK